jgi:FixJ family two-component response regulator
MPGIRSERARGLRKEHEVMEAVILTGHGSVGWAVERTRFGA